MKVLDLQCAHQHRFEGWFDSEDDFRNQLARGQLQCPVCGDAAIVKRLSAPRLNFGSTPEPGAVQRSPSDVGEPESAQLSRQASWLAMVRHIVANTDDVGRQFADEARRMHYGEIGQRAIRGEATVDEALEMIDEGIEVMPLPGGVLGKERLQ